MQQNQWSLRLDFIQTDFQLFKTSSIYFCTASYKFIFIKAKKKSSDVVKSMCENGQSFDDLGWGRWADGTPGEKGRWTGAEWWWSPCPTLVPSHSSLPSCVQGCSCWGLGTQFLPCHLREAPGKSLSLLLVTKCLSLSVGPRHPACLSLVSSLNAFQ